MPLRILGVGADEVRHVSQLVSFEVAGIKPGGFSFETPNLALDSMASNALEAGWKSAGFWLRKVCHLPCPGLRLRVTSASSAVGGGARLTDSSYSAASFALSVAQSLSLPLDPTIAITGAISVVEDRALETKWPSRLDLKALALVLPARWLLVLGSSSTPIPPHEERRLLQEGRVLLAPNANAFLSYLFGPALVRAVLDTGSAAMARELVIQALQLTRDARFLPPHWIAGLKVLASRSPELADIFASPEAPCLSHLSLGDRFFALGCVGRATRNHDAETSAQLLSLYPSEVDFPPVTLASDSPPFIHELLVGFVTYLRQPGHSAAEIAAALNSIRDFMLAVRGFSGNELRNVPLAAIKAFAAAVADHPSASKESADLAKALGGVLVDPSATWTQQLDGIDAYAPPGQGMLEVTLHFQENRERGAYAPVVLSLEENAARPPKQLRVRNPVLLNESLDLIGGTPLWANPQWIVEGKFKPPPGWTPDDGPFESSGVLSRARIRAAFGSGLIFHSQGITRDGQVRDLGRGVAWRDAGGVWPPSVDSFHILGYLGANLEADSLASVLDIGCGSGILGLAAAYWAGRTASEVDLTLVDTQLEALGVATGNAARVSQRIRVAPYAGAAQRLVGTLQARISDLCICAPPYLPRTQELKGHLWPAVAGTDLLLWVVANASTFSRRLILQFSQVCWGEVEPLLRDSDRVVSLGLAAFAIPPYSPYCEWPPDLPWAGAKDDLRELLEKTSDDRLTPGLRHFRDHILPCLLDVMRPESWPHRKEWEWARRKPYRFYHRLFILDRSY